MPLVVLQFRVSQSCCVKEALIVDKGTTLVASNDRPNTNGNRVNSKHYAGPMFKARPMKHYRKRLLPNTLIQSTKTNMRSLEAPGGSFYSNNDVFSGPCKGLVYLQAVI